MQGEKDLKARTASAMGPSVERGCSLNLGMLEGQFWGCAGGEDDQV